LTPPSEPDPRLGHVVLDGQEGAFSFPTPRGARYNQPNRDAPAEERMDRTKAAPSPPRPRTCPRCGSHRFARSRRSRLERLLGPLGLRPYRCARCRTRFWRFG
jgi:hypothetical protein